MTETKARKARTYLSAIILGAALTGCASAPNYYSPTSSIVNVPEVNTQANVEVGQTMISKANLAKVPAVKLSTDYSEVVNFPGKTTIHKGSLGLYATDEEGKYYRDGTATYTMMGAAVPATNSGIFVPNDKTKPAVIYHRISSGYKYGAEPVALTQAEIERWSRDSFKRELVYSGISDNTISILYREYYDNMARPAFSQDLKYDLSKGKTIGYKGARFEVISATNTELTYKVTKALD